MIRQCFQTSCKEWMTECHWYCDSIKGASFLRRCKDCLSFRGQHCMDCFELVSRFSSNSPSTSTTSPYIDYAFSNEIIKKSLAEIDIYCHGFIENLNDRLRKVPLLEKKIKSVRYDVRNCFNNPDIRLVPIGSAVNHLLNNSSDLDLVILPSNSIKEWKSFMNKFSTSEQFRNEYIKKTYRLLVAKQVGKVETPFYRARVPIIRFMSKKRLQVDIQFGNIEPIRSSLFIRTCVEYDERVPLLIHWLTNKFREANILGSHRSLFSRYHVNILVIHFLQAIPYPVLPDVINSSPWLDSKNDWNNAVKVLTRQGSLYVPSYTETPNEQSVGALAVQLIDYYSQIDFYRSAINTRGQISQK
ncbi:hypothetical protein CAEBREN_04684 [Caenorhabditis brenneri]|uniref:Poly(A) RNA polymerase mitochondrial-like central palm domain-containing protein n=1 Tax=Caenorhabditis brenneri TaxID=135651 RepID=G0NM57_CAEBE|nr:hypothetical protein CAEBREN_04684 [Caenorhabditis brenneri]